MAAVDLNRGSSNVASLLPQDVSQEIHAKMIEGSLVQRLARRISIPGSGLTIPVITGEPTASWVAESDNKPVSRHTLNKMSLTPKKLAVIEPFSDEFRRDLPGLYAELVRRLPASLGKAFDEAALTGDRTQVGSFYLESAAAATNADISTLTAATAYADTLAAITKVANNGFDADGVVVSPAGEAILMGATTTAGSPLFIPSAMQSSGVGSVFGRPVIRTRNLPVGGDLDLDADGSGAGVTEFDIIYGMVGQWDKAIWGTVEGIKVSFSDQATLTDGGTQINLWQRNMFAVRAEIEIGFLVAEPKAFVLLTDAPNAAD